MTQPPSTARRGEAERVALVKRQKKRDKHTATALSVLGILGFLLLWQAVAASGLLSERFLASPIEIVDLFFVKLVDPSPDGAVLGINILSSLTVALTGFGLAIAIGIPLGLLMGWYRAFDSFKIGRASCRERV